MMISYRYVLVLALLRLAATVLAAPTPADSVSNEMSQVDKSTGVRLGTGVNLPKEDKETLQDVEKPKQRRGVPGPVRIGQGNADNKSFSAVPVQNYKNDAARLPVLENMQGTEGQDVQE